MGKSTVSGFFREEGVPVNDADAVIFDRGTRVHARRRKHLGRRCSLHNSNPSPSVVHPCPSSSRGVHEA